MKRILETEISRPGNLRLEFANQVLSAAPDVNRPVVKQGFGPLKGLQDFPARGLPMTARPRIQKRPNHTLRILALTLTDASLLWAADTVLHAQQEPDRQLVQGASANPNAPKRFALAISNGAYQNAKPLKKRCYAAGDNAQESRAFDQTRLSRGQLGFLSLSLVR